MTKQQQERKLKRQPAKIKVTLEFDHPKFLEMPQEKAKLAGVTVEQLYSRCIQSELGRMGYEDELGEWGNNLARELKEFVHTP